MAFPNQVARKLARPVRAPSAPPPPQPSVRMSMQSDVSQLDDAYEYAKQNRQADSSGFYPLEDYSSIQEDGGTGDPGAAKIARTTFDDFAYDQYGDEWDPIRQSLLDAGSHPMVSDGMSPDERDMHFQEPLYTVIGDTAHNGGFMPHLNLIETNPQGMHMQEPGFPLMGILGHEAFHSGNMPSKLFAGRRLNSKLYSGDPFAFTSAGQRGTIEQGIDRAWRESGQKPLPGQRMQMYGQLGHKNDVNEIIADMGLTRALNYGLTGEIPIEPGEWSEMFDRILQNPVRPVQRTPNLDLNNFFPGALTPFPDDPIMQYGPRAGQPAAGWNQLQFYWDQIHRGLLKKDRDLLHSFGPHIASNQESPDAPAV